MALHNDVKPVLFSGEPRSEPLVPYPEQWLLFDAAEAMPRSCGYHDQRFLNIMDDELIRAWEAMRGFCSLVELSAETKLMLAEETLLETMASVLYRLLEMRFEPTSVSEGMRLGLLAFCSHVFMKWQDVGLSYNHFPSTYRKCLLDIQGLEGVSARMQLWLLTVGAMAVFKERDDQWLTARLRATMELCRVQSWTEVQEIMRSIMWIGLVHDQPGKAVFEAAMQM